MKDNRPWELKFLSSCYEDVDINTVYNMDVARRLYEVMSKYLTNKEIEIILRRYRDNETLEKIGEEFGRCKENIRQTLAKSRIKIEHNASIKEYILFNRCNTNREELIVLKLSTRAYNILRRCNIKYIDELVEAVKSGKITNMYYLDNKSRVNVTDKIIIEVVEKLVKQGYINI